MIGREMRLPASVQEIANVIGRERALYLVGQLPRCYSGTPGKKSWHVILYVPKAIKPDHPLVRILGWADASALVRHFPGEILQPANCADVYRRFRDENIGRLIRERIPLVMIADWFAVSERHVKNIAREIPQEEIRAANDNNPPVNHRGSSEWNSNNTTGGNRAGRAKKLAVSL